MSMITDSENLLKAAVTASGESLTAARAKIEKNLRSAGAVVADASQPVFDRTRKTAVAADDYVRGHAWTVVGVAVAVGVLIGFLSAKR
jgi:ElaB/YqjD/DUF883 family membrane-anchored ribosome-binding protein